MKTREECSELVTIIWSAAMQCKKQRCKEVARKASGKYAPMFKTDLSQI